MAERKLNLLNTLTRMSLTTAIPVRALMPNRFTLSSDFLSLDSQYFPQFANRCDRHSNC
jgi:hypothetical protein